ncbi:MAG TPA: hypothetical protein VGD06_13125 [Acidobacteriota bacterium]|jgi:hypothetical protein
MKLRKRTDSDDRPAGDGGADACPSGDLDRLQSRGAELLGAADAAIERALSGDSRKFLEATRQQGGQ